MEKKSADTMSIAELSKLTGLPPSAIQAMGKFSAMNIYLARKGIDAAVNCEDSRMAGQYDGDAVKDIRHLNGE